MQSARTYAAIVVRSRKEQAVLYAIQQVMLAFFMPIRLTQPKVAVDELISLKNIRTLLDTSMNHLQS